MGIINYGIFKNFRVYIDFFLGILELFNAYVFRHLYFSAYIYICLVFIARMKIRVLVMIIYSDI